MTLADDDQPYLVPTEAPEQLLPRYSVAPQTSDRLPPDPPGFPPSGSMANPGEGQLRDHYGAHQRENERPQNGNPQYIHNRAYYVQAQPQTFSTGPLNQLPLAASQVQVARKRWLVLIAAVVAVAIAATVGGIFGYNRGESNADGYYKPRASAMSSQLSVLQAAQSKRSSEASEIPDLVSIAARYPSLEPETTDSTSLEVTLLATGAAEKVIAIRSFMADLGFSSAVMDRLSKTRALDGTLTAQGHNCNVSWTYHPDHGLQMVFEAKAG